MKLVDLTGKRFGRLLVIERADNLKKHIRWRCRCDCGKECIVHGNSLKSGNTKSCGCYKTENARKLYSGVRQNDKKLYSIWAGIKQRCFNKKHHSYKDYGGRGIKMDDKWVNNYESFYLWAIQSGYKHGLEIDRIDNDGDYCEGNCRFVSREIQANNKRNVKKYTIDGVTKSLQEWCREYKQPSSMVYQRIKKLGWSLKDALTTPKKQ